MVFNAFDTYCSAVCVMVRWKRYHAPITAELTAHMEDHADYLIAKGVEPDEAARAAVAAMGDPYEIGKELDKLHSPWYPRLTRIFAVLAAVLLLVSVVIRLNNLTPYPTFDPFADPAQLLSPGNSGTILTQGRATGGGTLGAYTFSDGAAALREYERDDAPSTYELELLLSAHTPWFWLGNPVPDFIPGRLNHVAYNYISAHSPDVQGLFLRFSRISLTVEPPFRDSYTFDLGPNGEVSYTITLEGVAAP